MCLSAFCRMATKPIYVNASPPQAKVIHAIAAAVDRFKVWSHLPVAIEKGMMNKPNASNV